MAHDGVMMSIKHVVFISKSKLSQNLIELIVKTIPRKIDFTTFDDLHEVALAFFPKNIQLVILDHNSIPKENSDLVFQQAFGKRQLKQAKKILMFSRDVDLDHEYLKAQGFQHSYAKPFLPDELIDMVSQNLGIR